MKEFEEHLKTNYPNVRPTSCDAEWARQNWIAALKWIYNEGALSPSDLAGTAIKKELEEK